MHNDGASTYTQGMDTATSDLRAEVRRTTVEIDLDVLAAAKLALGTVTTRETIDAALRQVDRRARLARAAELIASGALDVPTPEELDALRRPRG